jgi:hypothetical protein
MLSFIVLSVALGAVRCANVDQTLRPQTFADVAAENGLTVNICNDISGEKFLCEKIFGEFCTYCRRDDGNKCVTKKGVKRAEASALLADSSCRIFLHMLQSPLRC